MESQPYLTQRRKERPKAGREEALARSQQQVRNRAGLNLVLFTPFPPPLDKGSFKSSQAGRGLSSGWAGSSRKGALFLPTSCRVLEPSTMPSPFWPKRLLNIWPAWKLC